MPLVNLLSPPSPSFPPFSPLPSSSSFPLPFSLPPPFPSPSLLPSFPPSPLPTSSPLSPLPLSLPPPLPSPYLVRLRRRLAAMLFMLSKGFAFAWTQPLLDATVLSGLATPCFSLVGHALDTLLQMSISDCR